MGVKRKYGQGPISEYAWAMLFFTISPPPPSFFYLQHKRVGHFLSCGCFCGAQGSDKIQCCQAFSLGPSPR